MEDEVGVTLSDSFVSATHRAPEQSSCGHLVARVAGLDLNMAVQNPRGSLFLMTEDAGLLDLARCEKSPVGTWRSRARCRFRKDKANSLLFPTKTLTLDLL